MKKFLTVLLSLTLGLTCLFAIGCKNEDTPVTEADCVLSYKNETLTLSNTFSCNISEVLKIETYRGVFYSSTRRFENQEDVKDFFAILFKNTDNVISFNQTHEFEDSDNDFNQFKLFNSSVTLYKAEEETSSDKLFEFFIAKETNKAYFETNEKVFVAEIKNIDELFGKYI